jgi:hypothetical protein
VLLLGIPALLLFLIAEKQQWKVTFETGAHPSTQGAPSYYEKIRFNTTPRRTHTPAAAPEQPPQPHASEEAPAPPPAAGTHP